MNFLETNGRVMASGNAMIIRCTAGFGLHRLFTKVWSFYFFQELDKEFY